MGNMLRSNKLGGALGTMKGIEKATSRLSKAPEVTKSPKCHAAAPERPLTNQRMSRPDDARALRSRDALKEGLLRLIERNPFDQISIRDITTAAGVSYPVFFRRYRNKEELLADIAAEEVRNLLARASPMMDRDSEESMRGFCNFVKAHRKLWTTLLTTGATSIMRAEFIRIAKEIAATRKRSNPWLPVDLAASFVVSGIFEILAWWLQQPASYPIENVMTFLDVLIVRSTARPVKIKLLKFPISPQ
jgi:AcrR family transcriptional regulator